MWDMAPGLSPGKAGKPCCSPIAGVPGILTLWVPVIAEERNRGRRHKGRKRQGES